MSGLKYVNVSSWKGNKDQGFYLRKYYVYVAMIILSTDSDAAQHGVSVDRKRRQNDDATIGN